MRVLIAHAHPIEVLGLTDILHTLEYVLVGSVASGQEAILAAAEHQPDLMLVDGDLKGEVDGIAAAVEIHNRLGIRSIVLAEQCDRTVRARAAEALPVATLDKTSPMSAIADALRMGAKHHHRLALLHHNATLGDAHSPACVCALYFS